MNKMGQLILDYMITQRIGENFGPLKGMFQGRAPLEIPRAYEHCDYDFQNQQPRQRSGE